MEHSTDSIPADQTVASGNGRSKQRRDRTSDADEGKARPRQSRSTDADAQAISEERLAYARLALEEMAIEAICNGRTGTLGVEIPIKEGDLGRVKRLWVEFQPD